MLPACVQLGVSLAQAQAGHSHASLMASQHLTTLCCNKVVHLWLRIQLLRRASTNGLTFAWEGRLHLQVTRHGALLIRIS